MNLHKIVENSFSVIKLKSKTKDKVLRELISELEKNNIVNNADSFFGDITHRESLASTFMENHIAIPHARSAFVTKVGIVIGISEDLIPQDTDSIHSPMAKIFFMIATPNNAEETHLILLSEIAQYLVNDDFCRDLQKITNKNSFINLINKYHNKTSSPPKESPRHASNNYDIVAVTACPVGIAHTYLASEKLEQVAKKMGLKIKVQTNGSIGLKNELTSEDIAHAKAVILATDIAIDETVFIGKAVTKVKVSTAINKTKETIQNALSNTTKFTTQQKESSPQNNLGLYSHLLTGVSFMIPFVVVGGMLIALSIALSGVDSSSGATISNEWLRKLENLGAMSFSLMVPILAGYIGFSIAGKPALAPAMLGGMIANQIQAGFLGGIVIGFLAGYFVKMIIKIPVPKNIATIMPVIIIPIIGALFSALIMYSLGGYIAEFMSFLTKSLKHMQTASIFLAALLGLMIASDMGGPINKVAFLFGASMIAEGLPTIMGIIAVAVCTPPLGMWLATITQPKKYYEDEKQAGKAAFFMGLIGITEGAIPFAAGDPLRVIPSLMVGSAVGGMVASYYMVADYAPHGGPIVLPVIEHKLAFLGAILIGAITTAIMINILKTKKSEGQL